MASLADVPPASTVLEQPPPPSLPEPSIDPASSDTRTPPPALNGVTHHDSESDLSDPPERRARTPPSPASPEPTLRADDMTHTMDIDHTSSEEEEQDAEGDEDFEMDAPQPQPPQFSDAASSSDDSIRPAKRKAQAVEEDDHITNNPELYGLRRSGRARPTATMAESSAEEEDDSDVPRRPRKRLRQASRRSSKQATPVIGSAGSGSDSDAYGGKRHKLTKKQKQRFLSNNLVPPNGEVRFSSRRAGKVSSYNEDQDDDMFDDDDPDQLTPSYYIEEDDNSPAIDVVLNHRLHVESTPPPQEDKIKDPEELKLRDFDYFVKYQNKSYYHSTWEPAESLMKMKGYRRLENYFRKVVVHEIHFKSNPDNSLEDKEKFMLDREQQIDALEDYKKVERVIGNREGEEGPEYFVKWKSLAYDLATWESAALIEEIAQDQIDKYLNRQQEDFRSNSAEARANQRASYQPFREQPPYIQGGTLRDFQVKGLNFLAYNWTLGKNVVLADEMGLGKTVQTVSFMSWLRHDRDQQGPFLVVVPLSTMPAWADTFDFWAPDLNYVVYNGNARARDVIKEFELFPNGSHSTRFHALLTTYEYVLSDASFLSQIKWQFMAVDEAHRLKNRESQLYDRLLEFKAPSRLLITGTPVQNNLSELSALFDFLNPGVVSIDENMDLSTEEATKKIEQLTKDIQPFMLRRTKQRVETDLPPKTEKIIRVELSDLQLTYYKNILTKNYAALNEGAKGQKSSLLNIMMELKKASNHPFMFPAAEERMLPEGARREEVLKALVTSSGKMMLLDQLLGKLKKDGHRVLIFSQMVKMLDILGDYMDLRGHSYQRLDGTIASGPRRTAIEHFNAPDSTDFCFLLSTRAGGLGINLMTADIVIIFDSDWNPQADLQAMARAHRIGQTKPVSVYRLVSKETVEEEILERARNKLMLEFLTIQRGITDKDTQARRNAMVGEPGSTSEISRILKKRGQKMFEQTDNQKKLEELDLDAVLEKAEDYKVEQPDGTEADGGEEFLRNFDFVDVKVDEMSWDDIIPKEQLEEIRKEEQRKADEQFLARAIEESKPRSRNPPSDERPARQQRRIEHRQQMPDSDSEEEMDKNRDPTRPLGEREYRYLIKGHLRYGSMDDRTEEFLTEARLRGRDMEVVKKAMDEIVAKATELHKAEQQRMADLERTANRPVTKKDKKAVLFELHGVKRINAETILERPVEMRLLREVIPSDPEKQLSFRIPGATKAAGYTCDWGAREDGMLCVGVLRHGYGAWERIRDDVDLKLQDKFFLEEHRVDKKAEREHSENKNAKSPGAVHLVRRADYLLSVLKAEKSDDPAIRRAVENHHRNNKKHSQSVDLKGGAMSPTPGSHRKPYRESDKHRPRTVSSSHRDSMERHGTPKTDARHGRERDSESREHKKHRPQLEQTSNRHSSDHRQSSDHHRRVEASSNGSTVDQLMEMVFKPMRGQLKDIRATTKSAIPDSQERASTLRKLLTQIGKFVDEQLKDLESGADPAIKKRLW
jgi:chromodomain-helicase-DNA-binding protein 1